MQLCWYGKHFGEEPPLVGSDKQGSGTIFFSHCNLKCVFCQNYQISQEGLGNPCSAEELAKIMLDLQKQGAANINLISPTIWWKTVAVAIRLVRPVSLIIPIIWNSNGYESVAMLKELEGLVDIYLPDFKYSDDELALKYSGIKNYAQTTFEAIKEMWRQVGELKIENGTARKGLIVRHLILPNNTENSLGVLNLLTKIDTKIHISLMSQYQPFYKVGRHSGSLPAGRRGAAGRTKNLPVTRRSFATAQDDNQFSELNRTISQKEFTYVYDHLTTLGFENGWTQELNEQKSRGPDFKKKKPFNF